MNDGFIVPCLWLDDQAEQAASFYTELLPGGRITGVSRYPQSSDNPSGKPPGSVLTVEFVVAGQRFTALNGGPQFVMNPSISLFVEVPSEQEAQRVFTALAEGGEVLMPLDAYPWSPRYGWTKDRYGVSWQVITKAGVGEGMRIVPCLMFSGAQHRQAEPAMQTYVDIFPQARIETVERYAPGEGPEDTVKHGRFVLNGVPMVVMDSHIDHGVSFNEALSFQVMCADQAEIDRYWEALSEGGGKGPCGWLKDRYGLSWQVVPRDMPRWMTSEDVLARDRVFAAMMGMGKLDVAALQAAFDGR